MKGGRTVVNKFSKLRGREVKNLKVEEERQNVQG